ncbi:hypothetical protein An07g04210 [Aspergillus niger]|uniref:Uncharacterized protein n=2 Tax=Aspergillus niger TaxID=5061 RepID=A2QN30_ASPNC|nr:hypothetical protein An07g04210 [Aspergillus niger]CAK48171.1 hypothetical protein An07g04210 [Aspergillus niger]
MCTRIDGALGHQTIAIPLPPDRGGGGDMVLGGCISMIESQADVSHWERYSLGCRCDGDALVYASHVDVRRRGREEQDQTRHWDHLPAYGSEEKRCRSIHMTYVTEGVRSRSLMDLSRQRSSIEVPMKAIGGLSASRHPVCVASHGVGEVIGGVESDPRVKTRKLSHLAMVGMDLL